MGSPKPSGSGINPCFLWDNSIYMLGYDPKDKNPDRTQKCFEAFRQRHVELESQIASESFTAVCRFLENWDPASAAEFATLAELTTGFGLFQIIGQTKHVHQDPVIKSWWRENGDPATSAFRSQCLISGKVAPIAATHPSIKGVAGAQPAGAAIVSFNDPAYESYGHSQSLNAPVSQSAAFRYTTALNALLDGPQRGKHRMPLGSGTTVAFWTDRPSTFEDITTLFFEKGSRELDVEQSQDAGTRKKLESFLLALRSGREAYGDLNHEFATEYYLLGLSPNQARLSIRFWHSGTLGDLLDNLRAHFHDIQIVRPTKAGVEQGVEFLSIQDLLDQTCPRKSSGLADRGRIPPVLEGPLLRAIVTNVRYPTGLFQAVIRRLHADPTISHPRASIIKGYLNRNHYSDKGKEIFVSLDKERVSPSYRLGRLFAVLEKAQTEAIEGINSTIRDRYYGAASATPRSVFPKLLRTFQHHISKLHRGRKTNIEKIVQEILGPVDNFPAHFNLTDQGEFAIGYYHQRNDLFTPKDGASPEADVSLEESTERNNQISS